MGDGDCGDWIGAVTARRPGWELLIERLTSEIMDRSVDIARPAHRRMPFVGSDKIIYAVDAVSPYMLHCILEMDGYIQEQPLGQAIMYALAKSPSLKSIARLRKFASYWEVVPDLTPYSIFVVKDLSEEDDVDKASEEFLRHYVGEYIDITQAPPVRFLLLRPAKGQSVFVVKAHHCAVDPIAILNTIEDVQNAYSKLVNAKPLPPVGEMADRSRKRLFRRVSLRMWGRVIWIGFLKVLRGRRLRPRCFVRFGGSKPGGTISYRSLSFAGRQYADLRTRCKSFAVTANELVMAALCRAIRQWNGKEERADGAYSIVMPVDLRWYAREGGKVPRVMASFIGGTWVTVPVSGVTTFEATLEYVTRETRYIKDHHLGLLANLGFPLLYFLPPSWMRRVMRRYYERHPSTTVPTAVFAYVGSVDRALSVFPGCRVKKTLGVGTGFYPVGLNVVVGFSGRVYTVTVTYLKTACSEVEIDQFMTLFGEEILPKPTNV